MIYPYRVRSRVFEDTFASRLLAYAIENESRFQPSETVGDGTEGIDRSARVSSVLRSLGSLKEDIRERLLKLAPDLMVDLGIPRFDISKIEVEMAAHNDGAFFDTHVDTIDYDQATLRLMSAVYYFHKEPKRYCGGALRIYALGPVAATPRYRDIDPEHNSLVFFPSWAPHEVRPTVCPSGAFADSRFAINAWFLRQPA